jgi:hypothetical protein
MACRPFFLIAVLRYASYPASEADRINALAVGPDGCVHIVGVMLASPAASEPVKLRAGGSNALVARFSADGSRLLYLTYLGKSGSDETRSHAFHLSHSFLACSGRHTDGHTRSKKSKAKSARLAAPWARRSES